MTDTQLILKAIHRAHVRADIANKAYTRKRDLADMLNEQADELIDVLALALRTTSDDLRKRYEIAKPVLTNEIPS